MQDDHSSMDGPPATARPSPDRSPQQPSRREVLTTGALLLGGTILARAGLPAAAAAATPPDFLALSQALTGHGDLAPVTAARIAEALGRDAAPGALEALAALAPAAESPEALMAAARAAGLGDLAAAVVASWYRGTVETKAGPVLVAYKEALMYRPVADGTTVPTYCNFGPMWWRDQLPPGVTHVPHNSPEVL